MGRPAAHTLGCRFIGLAVAVSAGQSCWRSVGAPNSRQYRHSSASSHIELIPRRRPLITILFMGVGDDPAVLSPTDPDHRQALRAQIGMESCSPPPILTEVVRGGLQAIPKGQYEAADSLGLGYWRKMRLIILPQALTISIPPAGQYLSIGFFKDTSLVVINRPVRPAGRDQDRADRAGLAVDVQGSPTSSLA